MTITYVEWLTFTKISPIIFLFSSGFVVMHRILVTRVLELGSLLSIGIVVVPWRNCWLALITGTKQQYLSGASHYMRKTRGASKKF
jgi:hypothetical protein